MKSRITPVVVAFATCFSLSAVSASADEAAEAFLKSWIGSIDASADWQATYASVAIDEASDGVADHFFDAPAHRQEVVSDVC